MEYIKAKDFFKQSKEIQKIFINWWKCDFGDLYVDNREYEMDKNYCDINCVNMNLEGDIEGDWEYFKTISTPIFSEGQLRKFIEDKANNTIRIESNYYEKCYLVNVDTGTRGFNGLSESLLQAYWTVSVEIAKEELK